MSKNTMKLLTIICGLLSLFLIFIFYFKGVLAYNIAWILLFVVMGVVNYILRKLRR